DGRADRVRNAPDSARSLALRWRTGGPRTVLGSAPMYLPLLLLLLGAAPAATPDTPMLSDAQKEEILAKTQVIRLDADLSTLSDSGRCVVERLMEVGAIFQDVYESSRLQQALPVRRSLEQAPAESLDRRLYR